MNDLHKFLAVAGQTGVTPPRRWMAGAFASDARTCAPRERDADHELGRLLVRGVPPARAPHVRDAGRAHARAA